MDVDTKTTAYRTFYLKSERRLVVEIVYDRASWELERSEEMEDLEEFAVNFNSLSPLSLSDHPRLHFKMAEHECLMDCTEFGAKKYVRARVGPLLAANIGESTVVAVSSQQPVAAADHFASILFYRDPALIVPKMITRIVHLESALKIGVLPEVLGLHSAYFLNLFFGEFCERRGRVVLADVRLNQMRHLLRDVYTRHDSWQVSFAVNSHELCPRDFIMQQRHEVAALVRLCDRWLVRFSPTTDALVRQMLSSRSLEDDSAHLETLLSIVQIYERRKSKLDALDLLLGRFAFSSCLTSLLSAYYDRFTADGARRVLERIYALEAASHRRPKLHLTYDGGAEMMVEVPTDVYPYLQMAVDLFNNERNEPNSKDVLYGPDRMQQPFFSFRTRIHSHVVAHFHKSRMTVFGRILPGSDAVNDDLSRYSKCTVVMPRRDM